MPIRTGLILALLALAAAVGPSSRPALAGPVAPPAAESCGSAEGLRFLCGVTNAEDLVVVPGTPWIVASGLGAREGIGPPGALRLIDGRSKTWRQAYPTWRQWYPADPANTRRNTEAFPACPGPPGPASLVAHGLGLRAAGPGRPPMVYVVNHDKDERIDAFELDLRPAWPTLTWVGCVLFPKPLQTNSVAVAPDGTLFASVLRFPGKELTDVRAGAVTGAIYQWTPGTADFVKLAPELSGPNGIDISADGRTLYISEFGRKRILIYDRADLSKPTGQVQFADFWPDNVHWDDQGRLIAAGMNHNYDDCIDAPRAARGPAPTCVRRFTVEAIDPKTLRHKVLAQGETHPEFSNVSSGLVVRGVLWLGSYRADRIAYRPAPARALKPLRTKNDR